jgi:hypothetical protein
VVASRFERGWVVKWGRWASGSGRPCVSAGHPCEGKEGREGGEEEELHLREERTAARESYHRRQELSPPGESRRERATVSRPPMELLDFHVYWRGSGVGRANTRLCQMQFFSRVEFGPTSLWVSTLWRGLGQNPPRSPPIQTKPQ